MYEPREFAIPNGNATFLDVRFNVEIADGIMYFDVTQNQTIVVTRQAVVDLLAAIDDLIAASERFKEFTK